MTLHSMIIIVSLIMLVCVYASKFLTRIGVPILIFFIGAGMLLGSEGIFGIYFDNPFMTRDLGNIALCFIMFYGGMDLNWKSAKPIVGRGLLLSTVGVVLTAAMVGLVAHYLIGISMINGILLGAVLSSTDAASIFSTLKAQKIRLKGNVASLLEFESGSNDPMAYMLTMTILGIIEHPQNSVYNYIIMLLKEFIFGAIIGIALGYGTVQLLNRIKLNIESMYFIVSLALMMFTYSFLSFIGGNSFLAVYIAGIIIGNSNFIRKMHLLNFFDGQSWLAQIILFLTLGLQVFPSHLMPIAFKGMIIAVALIFVIRPIVVFILMAPFKMPLNENLFISFAGFRGAASIVFATYPFTINITFAQDIFDIVFFIALTSIMFQGTCIKYIAKHLGLLESDDKFSMQNFHLYADELSDMPVLGVYVPNDSPAVGKSIRDLDFPYDVRIVAIRQKERYSTPKGKTTIYAGDRMLLTALNEENIGKVCRMYKFDS